MALEWQDKVDGVDDVLADDINEVAHAVMDLEADNEESADLLAELNQSMNEIIYDQEKLIGGAVS